MEFGEFNTDDVRHIKSVEDIRQYLDCVIQEDVNISDIKYSIKLLLMRIEEIACQSNAQAH